MADHLERTPREPARENTPVPTYQDVFDFIEDKFKGKEQGPRFLELKLAFGPGGGTWRDDTLHQKEFKKNHPPPSRPEMVEIANLFMSIAQTHCNQLGKPQGFVILAVNHEKGAHPYGVIFKKLRPTMNLPREMVSGSNLADGEILEDNQHRDILLREHRESAQLAHEHVRLMHDVNMKYTGQLFATLQEENQRLRAELQLANSQRLNWYTAMEEAASKKQEREIAAKKAEMWMNALERGTNFAISMIPVVTKTLERKDATPQLPQNGGHVNGANGHVNGANGYAHASIEPSSESMAIKAFVEGLSNDQRCALFGQINAETGEYAPGIFAKVQVDVLGEVMQLRKPASALDVLMPEGPLAITMEQVAKAIGVAGDSVMALNAIFLERRKQQQDAAQQHQGA